MSTSDLMGRPDAGGSSARDERTTGLFVVGAMAALMWVVEIIDTIDDHRLDGHGIRPRSFDGLDGILFSPFLHGGFGHLIGNTIPFLVLGAVIAFSGALRVLLVTAIVGLVAGIGTWLTAPSNSVTVGASGIVLGYATYLLARGIFSRRLMEIAVGVIVAVIWGGSFLFSLIPRPGVSWQAHLFGAIGGVVAAWLLTQERRRRQSAT